MKKAVGYILCSTGLASLILSVDKIKNMIKLTLPENITNTYLMIGGLILIFVGAYIITKNPSKKRLKKDIEVPIFKGKDIVGYRRH